MLRACILLSEAAMIRVFCSHGHALSMRVWTILRGSWGQTGRPRSNCPLSSEGSFREPSFGEESICCHFVWINPFIIWLLCSTEPQLKCRLHWHFTARPEEAAAPPLMQCRSSQTKQEETKVAIFSVINSPLKSSGHSLKLKKPHSGRSRSDIWSQINHIQRLTYSKGPIVSAAWFPVWKAAPATRRRERFNCLFIHTYRTRICFLCNSFLPPEVRTSCPAVSCAQVIQCCRAKEQRDDTSLKTAAWSAQQM